MTILPKKKVQKEKADGEESAPSPTGDGRVVVSHSSRRQGSPPPRWNSPVPIDERITIQDPGGRFEEPSTSHSKRRHRSSPHRTSRKHRHSERPAHHGPRQAWGEASQSASCSHSVASHRSYRPPTTTVPERVDAVKEGGYNSGDEYVAPTSLSDIPLAAGSNQSLEELERCFEAAMKEKNGFTIKRMGEDGACLFRCVADQVYGDQEMHSIVRKHCMDYMAKNADFYRQYVTEDFTTYLNRKRIDQCHGNHLEIQALTEIYNRAIEVYQYSTEPINTFHGAYKTDNEPIRLSYHGGVHYNSVVDPYKATIGVGLGLPGLQPGLAEKNLMCDALRQSEENHLEQAMLEDKMREADWELTQEAIDEQVARESYIQWLRDQEKRDVTSTSCSSTAACSSSACSESRMDSCLPPSAGPRSPAGSPTGWTPPQQPQQRSSRPGNSKNNTPHNSPNRNIAMDNPILSLPSPQAHAVDMFSSVAGGSGTPPPSTSALGAIGGCRMEDFPETSSLLNAFNPAMYGLSDWDEEDIMAQVIAQSQDEYLQSLKSHHAYPSPVVNQPPAQRHLTVHPRGEDSLAYSLSPGAQDGADVALNGGQSATSGAAMSGLVFPTNNSRNHTGARDS